MNIKSKKIKLAKMLISSSLLLSIASLPLAFASCSKKLGQGGKDKDPNHKKGYLFKLEPQLFDKDKKEVITDKLFVKDGLENFLDEKEGYNKDFFSKLDKTFGDSTFYEEVKTDGSSDTTPKYKKVEDLGDVVVYYLNSSDIAQTDAHISFDINEEVFGKFDKIDDIKKHISYKNISIENFKFGDEAINNGLVLKSESDSVEPSTVQFWKGLDNSGRNNFFGKDDKDVKEIKKLKIIMNSSDVAQKSLSNDSDKNIGFLVTFKPVKGSDEKTNKTIVIKYANNEECNFFKKEFYDSFETKLKNTANDYFVTCTNVGDKSFNDWLKEVVASEKFDETQAKTFAKPSTENVGKWELIDFNTIFNTIDEKEIDNYLNDLKTYLSEKHKLNLKVEHSKKHKVLCFDPSSLSKKVGDESCKYVLSVLGNETPTDNSTNENDLLKLLKMDVLTDNSELTLDPSKNTYDYNIAFEDSEVEKEVNVTIKFNYKDSNFLSKSKKITIKFKE